MVHLAQFKSIIYLWKLQFKSIIYLWKPMTLPHKQHLLDLTLINKPTRLQGSSLEPKPIFKNKNQIILTTIYQFTSLFSSLKKNFNPFLHSNNQVKFTHNLTFFASLPYSKYTVYQKATQETQNYIGPRIPGIQQHEFRGIHFHVLDREKRKLFSIQVLQLANQNKTW